MMRVDGNVAFSVLLLLAAQCSDFTLGASPAVSSHNKPTGQNCDCCKLFKQLSSQLKAQNEKLERKIDQLLAQPNACSQAAKDCADLYKCGKDQSGVYTIQPDGGLSFDVYCDMTTAGGGWTVFQKRLDGSVNFYRGWSDYKYGFGDLSGEFWLGLDKIKRLTNARQNKLHVDLQETNGNKAYAEYDYFAVSSEISNYKLGLGTYSGDAGDGLRSHRGYAFSTKDRDNDGSHGHSCAQLYHGAWWYEECHNSNLNGKYLHGHHASYADGINWKPWKGYHYSASRAEMKIRPVNF